MKTPDDEAGHRDSKPAEDQSPSPMAGVSAGYILLGSVVIGLAIGYGLDRAFNTSPGWTIGMSVVFIIAGLYHVVKGSQR